jgi:serine/threonine-protein kinase
MERQPPILAEEPPRAVDRYRLYEEIASGGMATVHYGRLLGARGFSRVVAIKRLHRHLSSEPPFRAMLLDEARLSSRVVHSNVVRTIDVIEDETDVLIVMDYVLGESLSRVLRAARERAPVEVAVAIVAGVLEGLHAAHEARDRDGTPLGIVHRDVSPQNILVCADGVPRLIDFGIAKAANRLSVTQDGVEKGKRSYMAPEQLLGQGVSRETDVFGTAVVLWELLAGRRLFNAEIADDIVKRATGDVELPPSAFAPNVPRALDAIVLRALSCSRDARPPTARAMADELTAACPPAPVEAVAAWLEDAAGEALERARERVAAIERAPIDDDVGPALGRGPVPEAVWRPVGRATGADVPTLALGSSLRRRPRSLLAAALGVVSLAVSTLMVTRLSGREGGRPVAEPKETVAATVAAPSIEPSVASAVVRDDAPPSSTEAASAPASPPAVRTPKPPKEAAPPSKRSTARTDCNPPYFLDAENHKIYRPDCF